MSGLRAPARAGVVFAAGFVLAVGGCATTAPGEPSVGAEPAWRPLLDGSLDGWTVTEFGGQGEVEFADGSAVLRTGGPLTGIHWSGANPLPASGYELEWFARRLDGSDFFTTLTFPIAAAPPAASCSLVVGGWGGALCGLSSLDGEDASENETTTYRSFEDGREHRFLLRVEPDRIRAWDDGERFVDVDPRGKRVSIRPEMDPSRPLGFATFATTGAIRAVRWRPLTAEH